MKIARLFFALWLLAGASAWAVEPGEVLSDPALEARARALSQNLRCLVCQNQSIDDSNAALARDLRVLLRERLSAGDSDDQAIAFIVARYGDFVLLKPRVTPATYVLWYGPIALLGVLLVFVVVRAVRKRASTTAPLTAEERARLRSLLDRSGE